MIEENPIVYKKTLSGEADVVQREVMEEAFTKTEDCIEIMGGVPLTGRIVESYNNKTLTLALSTAGMYANGETLIRKSQILDTTFPEFLPVLNSL